MKRTAAAQVSQGMKSVTKEQHKKEGMNRRALIIKEGMEGMNKRALITSTQLTAQHCEVCNKKTAQKRGMNRRALIIIIKDE